MAATASAVEPARSCASGRTHHAGVSFFLMASSPGASLATLAGYALLGGIFFLVSALRLHRAARRN